MVFNHTAEGNRDGPTLSLPGLDNAAYYILQNDAPLRRLPGTGNTFNSNHPIVRRMIVDCLRYWVTKCTSMAFALTWRRSSLATRQATVTQCPIIWDIESDPVLAGRNSSPKPGCCGPVSGRLVHGDSWTEWNGNSAMTFGAS